MQNSSISYMTGRRPLSLSLDFSPQATAAIPEKNVQQGLIAGNEKKLWYERDIIPRSIIPRSQGLGMDIVILCTITYFYQLYLSQRPGFGDNYREYTTLGQLVNLSLIHI